MDYRASDQESWVHTACLGEIEDVEMKGMDGCDNPVWEAFPVGTENRLQNSGSGVVASRLPNNAGPVS